MASDACLIAKDDVLPECYAMDPPSDAAEDISREIINELLKQFPDLQLSGIPGYVTEWSELPAWVHSAVRTQLDTVDWDRNKPHCQPLVVFQAYSKFIDIS